MVEEEARLMLASLKNTISLIKAQLDGLNQCREHDREMWLHRITELEKQAEDFEGRIREVTTGTDQFKLYLRLVGLGSGGALGVALLALINSMTGK